MNVCPPSKSNRQNTLNEAESACKIRPRKLHAREIRQRREVVGVITAAMLPWSDFAELTPDIAAAGLRLFEERELAFLASTGRDGRPRLHPFIPKVVSGRLVAFVLDRSPKRRDLDERGLYAIHALPGKEDESFFVSGRALSRNDESPFREAVAVAMDFDTGVDAHHILYEFLIDRVLWTTWSNFGTPELKPHYRKWSL